MRDNREEMNKLNQVLEEVRKQYDENRLQLSSYREDYAASQRALWEDVGPVSISNGLDQIADFMGHIHTMKNQLRSYEFLLKQSSKLERQLDSPYFGRIDFSEIKAGKLTEPEQLYIGTYNLISDAHEFLIYDWRSPLASMFYDYGLGEASYECADGTIAGEISLKRQYKIEKGELAYAIDSEINIDDTVLQDMLSQQTEQKMKTIITTIQREQNQVIRNDQDKVLVVQGAAGSGKTSVALHRIAYLMYKNRERLSPEQVIIFSPNELFGDYISSVLPQLGEDNVKQSTFGALVESHLRSLAGIRLEKYSDMMEALFDAHPSTQQQTRIHCMSSKSSAYFKDALDQFAARLVKASPEFEAITYGEAKLFSTADLGVLFESTYKDMPYMKRIGKIRERLKNAIPHEKRQGHSKKRLALLQQIDRFSEVDLLGLYRRFIQGYYSAPDDQSALNYTLGRISSGVLDYEDQIAMLYLKLVIGGIDPEYTMRVVVVDEAQDYTPLQYEILKRLYNRAHFTILGDIHQSIHPHLNIGSYDRLIEVFQEEQPKFIQLLKSYRSTQEINAFASQLLKPFLIEDARSDSYGRSGETPEVIHLALSESQRTIKKLIRTSLLKGHKSVGILTKSERDARKLFERLRLSPDVKLITQNTDLFINQGALIMPIYMAKGLEFDAVIIHDFDNQNLVSLSDARLLYTACTRALHELKLLKFGDFTGVIDQVV